MKRLNKSDGWSRATIRLRKPDLADKAFIHEAKDAFLAFEDYHDYKRWRDRLGYYRENSEKLKNLALFHMVRSVSCGLSVVSVYPAGAGYTYAPSERELVARGIAICSPTDYYDPVVGIAIAMGRAVKAVTHHESFYPIPEKTIQPEYTALFAARSLGKFKAEWFGREESRSNA